MARTRNLERLGVPAGLIAAAAGYFFLIDTPKSEATAAVREEVAARRRYIIEAEQLLERIKTAEVRLVDAEAHTAIWKQKTPSAEDVSSLYAALHHALRKGGASVMRFEPQQPVPLASLQQAPVAITLVGSQDALVEALVEIESMPVTIWVRDVRLSGAGENSRKIQLEAKLVIFADQAKNSH